MSRTAVFFDRDNTLIASDGYLGDPTGVQLLPGAADAVAKLRNLGYAIVTVSNQSGVARGMFSEDDVRSVNARMDQLLQADNPDAIVDRHEYCPFHPEAVIAIYRQDSELRKPRPGMLLKAAEALDIDLAQSWVIGDAPRDIAAGHHAGCRTILLRDPSLPPSPAATSTLRVAPDYRVESLAEAAAIIAEPHRPIAATTPDAHQPADADDAPGADSAPGVEGASDTESAFDVDNIPRADTASITQDAPATSPVTAVDEGSPPAAVEASTAPPPPSASPKPARTEQLLEEILRELRRGNQPDHADFSISKLLAGIAQVLVLAALFYAFVLGPHGETSVLHTLLFALILQTLTATLLIMGRQR